MPSTCVKHLATHFALNLTGFVLVNPSFTLKIRLTSTTLPPPSFGTNIQGLFLYKDCVSSLMACCYFLIYLLLTALVYDLCSLSTKS